MQASLYDFSPLARMLVMGFLLGSGPLLMVYLRHRRASPLGRMHALALVTLFLTFDLVMFGAFTRLTDSGLGCPDWPGCYGEASPLGASAEIAQAQQAMPTGPVTPGKAWIEMVHRYLAMGVGLLIVVLAVAAWRGRKPANDFGGSNPWWPTLTLIWVCIQGAFGAWTVTMKLFPAIVTLHLLGGYVLLALLTVQALQLARQQGLGPPVLCPDESRGVMQLIVFLRADRHGPGHPGRAVLAEAAAWLIACAGHLAGGGCGCRLQLHRGAGHRRQDEAHRLAPDGAWRAEQQPDAAVLGPCCVRWARRCCTGG
jgi:heme A synthase